MKKRHIPRPLGEKGLQTCSLCEGTGVIKQGKKNINNDNAYIAHTLRMSGYSFREIMRKMGYKSPSSVRALLNKETTAYEDFSKAYLKSTKG